MNTACICIEQMQGTKSLVCLKQYRDTRDLSILSRARERYQAHITTLDSYMHHVPWMGDHEPATRLHDRYPSKNKQCFNWNNDET